MRADLGACRGPGCTRQCRRAAAGSFAVSVLDLVREDLRGFGGYSSARSAKLQGDIWLNANESAWANPGDPDASCRR
ncbi:MAG: histidinol-phosphate transaminase, partial [Stenotrophomonas sp.]